MTELRLRLEMLAGPLTVPSPAVIRADLDRGRRAAARRRRHRASATVAVLAAGVALLLALGLLP